MDYGVFSDPSANWILIWTALALVFVGVLFLIMGGHANKVHEEKRAIFGRRISSDVGPVPSVSGWLAFFAFAAACVLILVGFISGCSQDILGEKYASPGAYKIVTAVLVYDRETLYENGTTKGTSYEAFLRDKEGHQLYQLTKPNHFELKLEGRADPSHPSTVRIVRILNIPYGRVAENYKYLPSDLPETQIDSEEARIAVTLPGFVVKYKDGWWQFTETEPGK